MCLVFRVDALRWTMLMAVVRVAFCHSLVVRFHYLNARQLEHALIAVLGHHLSAFVDCFLLVAYLRELSMSSTWARIECTSLERLAAPFITHIKCHLVALLTVF